MYNFESYELSPFPLDGQIDLGEKRGLIKICHSGDGHLILFCDARYVSLSETESTPLGIADIDAALGFVLDIGIKRTKRLTGAGGFYFGETLAKPQSKRKIAQSDFDGDLFERCISVVDWLFQSGDPANESLALRFNYLLQAYNTSRLLFPNFHNESYLGLLRIVDSVTKSRGGLEFATAAAEISPVLNKEVYKKVAELPVFQRRIDEAEKVFAGCLKNKKPALIERMRSLDSQGRLTFSCLYSAYQYRNKFVHYGLPFPHTVTETLNYSAESGMNYLNLAEGIAFRRRHSPHGVQPGDMLDFHAVIEDPKEASDFKDNYFKLLPTWHFLKRIVREAIIGEFIKMAEGSESILMQSNSDKR